MAYNLAYEETHRAPKYALKTYVDKKGRTQECSTKIQTGEFVERTHKVWRCSFCRGWFVGDTAPKICGKCKQ